MKRRIARVGLFALAVIALLVSFRNSPVGVQGGDQSEVAPLQLDQRIPVPGVSGRIDHFTAYPKRRLLIFAALGNNTLG